MWSVENTTRRQWVFRGSLREMAGVNVLRARKLSYGTKDAS